MKAASASLFVLVMIFAAPAATWAQYQERWSANASFNNSSLTPASIGDLDGDCANDDIAVSVNIGGSWHVQIRDLLTGAIEFTSTTGNNGFVTWEFFMISTGPSCGQVLLASDGSSVLVIDHGGTVAAPRNDVQGMREGLLPASPNPFRGRVSLSYTLAAPGKAELEVYDVAGRLVRRLGGDPMKAGEHRVDWDGRDQEGRSLDPGMYFYRLNVDGRSSEARKAIRLDP